MKNPVQFNSGRKFPTRMFCGALPSVAVFPIAIASFVFLTAVAAQAQTKNSPSEVLSAPAEVEFTPDLWALTTITNAVVDGQPTKSRLPFGEAARHLSSIFLGKVAVKKGPLVLLSDVNYADVHLSGSDVPSMVNQIDLRSLWATVGLGYVFTGKIVANGHRFRFDVQPALAAHYTSQDVAIKAVDGQTLRQLSAKWWTPTIGVNAHVASGAWGLRVVGEKDLTGSSRAASQAVGSLEYSPRSIKFGHPTFGVGYRYRYDGRTLSLSSEISTTLRGPMTYVTFHL